MALIGELVTKLTADASKFTKEMDAAIMKAQGFSKSMKSVGIAVAGAFVAMAGAAVLAVREIDHINKSIAATESQARLIGTTVEQYQRMSFMAASAGVETDRLTMALPKMSMRIAQAANGTGAASEAFKEFGVNAKELVNLKPEEQFNRLAKSIAGVNNRGDQLRLTWAAFDNESIALLNVFRMDMEKLGKEFDNLGLKISGSQAGTVAKLRSTQMQVAMIWEGFGQQVALALTDPFTVFLENLKEAVKDIGGFKVLAQDVAGIIQSAFNATLTTAGAIIKLLNEGRRASIAAQIQYLEVSEGIDGGGKVARVAGFLANSFLGGGDLIGQKIGQAVDALSGNPVGNTEYNGNILGTPGFRTAEGQERLAGLYKRYNDLTASTERLNKVFDRVFAPALISFIEPINMAGDAVKDLTGRIKEGTDEISNTFKSLKDTKIKDQIERILGVEMRQVFGGLSRAQMEMNERYAAQVRKTGRFTEEEITKRLPFQAMAKDTSSFDAGVRGLFEQVQGKRISSENFASTLGGLKSQSVGLGPQFTGVIDELTKFGESAGLVNKQTQKAELKIFVKTEKGLLAEFSDDPKFGEVMDKWLEYKVERAD